MTREKDWLSHARGGWPAQYFNGTVDYGETWYFILRHYPRSGELMSLKIFDTVDVFRPVPVSRKRARWDRKPNDTIVLISLKTAPTFTRLQCDRYPCQEICTTVIPASLRTYVRCTILCWVWTWCRRNGIRLSMGNSQPFILQSAVKPHTLFMMQPPNSHMRVRILGRSFWNTRLFVHNSSSPQLGSNSH